MDVLTGEFVRSVQATKINGLTAGDYIGRGASAAVFHCVRDGAACALKVFDPTFLDRFEEEIQKERIHRQLELREVSHPNLVQILDGGYCAVSGLYYLVMPYYDAPTLEDTVRAGAIPAKAVGSLISQVASAACRLEELGWAHRDIKPANIVVSRDFSKAVLLDLGVVRPFRPSELTDSTDSLDFVGTTRYSPPEFNMRVEEDSVEGWRAVTFYQLGGVLHDMLMGRMLFADRTPYQRLLYAIFVEKPELVNADAPQELLRLARLCLSKEPLNRLATVSWESFQNCEKHLGINDLRTRILSLRNEPVAVDVRISSTQQATRPLEELAMRLKELCVADKAIFPPHTFQLTESFGHGVIFSFGTSSTHGLPIPLHILLCVQDVTGSSSDVEICCAACLTATLPEFAPNSVSWNFKEVLDFDTEAFDVISRYLYATLLIASEDALVIGENDLTAGPHWCSVRHLV